MKKYFLLFITLLISSFIVVFFNSTKKRYIKDFILTTNDSSNAIVYISNITQNKVKFNFSLNGKFYSSLNDFIRQNKNSTDSEQIVLDLFNAQINSLVHENLFNEWGVMPLLTLNSRGFAICGRQSEIFCQIAKNAGFPSRKISLNGHVVSEVFYYDKWHLFDVDRKTYFKSNNTILSYEKLIKDPLLFNQKRSKNYIANVTTIFKKYNKKFTTTNDNKFINIKKNNTDTFLLSIPPNSIFAFPFLPDYKTDFYPYNTKAKLFVPNGFNGTIRNPLILINVEGTGEIKINNVKFTIPKDLELLRAKLFLSKQFINQINIHSTSDSFALVYMLNPQFTVIYSKNKLHLNASNSLKVSLIQIKNKSKSIIKPMHIELLNQYAKFAFELADSLDISKLNSLEDIYKKNLKSYCIKHLIDTNMVYKRIIHLNKILNNYKKINFDEPIIFSVLSIVLYADNEQFKNMYLLYYKYFKYKELIFKYKKIKHQKKFHIQ